MALGIPDKKPTGKGTNLGVPYDNSVPPANLMGKKDPPKNNVPEFQGPPGWQPPPTTAQTGGPVLPPNQNGPIFPQDSAQPISFNGGYYNPTTAPFGADMSQPGQLEQFWGNNQALWFQDPSLDWVDSQLGQFQDPWYGEQTGSEVASTIGNPGQGQQYWNGIKGTFNTMGNNVLGGYQGPNNAQEAYNMTKGMLPGSLQPKFDAYYDRMKDKVMSDVNSQAAARGSYGSNAALNNSIGAGLDIEAQRAKALTDFELANSANQREWQGLLGNQGRNADLSGLGIYGSQLEGAKFGLDRTRLGGELAFKAEQADFDRKSKQAELAFNVDDHRAARLGAGISTALSSSNAHSRQLENAFSAAGRAQDAFEGRTQNNYNNVTNFSNDALDYFSQNYDKLLGMDQQQQEQAIQSYIAQMADQRGWDTRTQERVARDFKDALDFLTNAKEAGMFG